MKIAIGWGERSDQVQKTSRKKIRFSKRDEERERGVIDY